MTAPAHRLFSPIGAVSLSIAVLVFRPVLVSRPVCRHADREGAHPADRAGSHADGDGRVRPDEGGAPGRGRADQCHSYGIAEAPAPPTETPSAAAQNELPPAPASQGIPLIPGSSAPVITRGRLSQSHAGRRKHVLRLGVVHGCGWGRQPHQDRVGALNSSHNGL